MNAHYAFFIEILSSTYKQLASDIIVTYDASYCRIR